MEEGEQLLMGLRDDDAEIFRERAFLDWAREAPESPGSYDYPANEEEHAAHQHAVKKWLGRKPPQKERYPDR